MEIIKGMDLGIHVFIINYLKSWAYFNTENKEINYG
jgi:hypothetical protein